MVTNYSIREILYKKKRNTELINFHYPFAVTVLKYGYEVGHISRLASQTVSFFPRKDASVGICEVTGAMVSRSPRLGLAIPCAVPVLWVPGLL